MWRATGSGAAYGERTNARRGRGQCERFYCGTVNPDEMIDRVSYPRTIAVLAACVAISGVPAYAVTWFGAMLVFHPLVAHGISAAVAAVVSLEAAGVWFHGWERLLRGTKTRRILRHAVLLVPAASAAFWGLAVSVGGFSSLASGDSASYALVPALAVGAVLAWVLWRSAVAYRTGRREGPNGGNSLG